MSLKYVEAGSRIQSTSEMKGFYLGRYISTYTPSRNRKCFEINRLAKICFSRALIKKFVLVEAAGVGMTITVTVKTKERTVDACEKWSRERKNFNLSICPLDAADV